MGGRPLLIALVSVIASHFVRTEASNVSGTATVKATEVPIHHTPLVWAVSRSLKAATIEMLSLWRSFSLLVLVQGGDEITHLFHEAVHTRIVCRVDSGTATCLLDAMFDAFCLFY